MSLESIIHEIASTKSGKVALENVMSLTELINSCDDSRVKCLSNKAHLNLLCSSLSKRISGRSTVALRARFSDADKKLIDCLSLWEDAYGASFPVFQSWLSLQRSRGLQIPNLAHATASAAESNALQLELLELEIQEGLRGVSSSMKCLESMLELFTPNLEEAFSARSLSTEVADRVRELEGENDELFQAARESFNYLSRKLLVKLENQSALLKQISPSSRKGAIIAGEIASVRTSRVFQHTLLLLSAGAGSKNQKRRRPVEDTEYNEWF